MYNLLIHGTIYTYLSGLKFLEFHPLMTYLFVAISNFLFEFPV